MRAGRHLLHRRPLIVGALTLTLLGAVALVPDPPHVSSGDAASGAACPTSADPGAYTVAGGSGRVVAALTARPESGGQGLLGLLILGPQGAARPDAVSLSTAAGRRLSLSSTATPGCLVARTSLSGLGPLRAEGRLAGASFSVRLALPERPGPAAALLARARRATLALPALQEQIAARPSLSVPVARVRTIYRAGVATSVSGKEVTRLPWPTWRSGFYWVSPGLQGARVVGTTGPPGRRLALVSGQVRDAPVWMTLAVDPASGRVESSTMLGAGHFMTSRYRALAAARGMTPSGEAPARPAAPRRAT